MAVHQVISFEVRPPLELARFKSWSSWVVLQVCHSTIVGYCWVFAESLGWSAVSVWAVWVWWCVRCVYGSSWSWQNCPTGSAADMADKVCSNWSCLPAECERCPCKRQHDDNANQDQAFSLHAEKCLLSLSMCSYVACVVTVLFCCPFISFGHVALCLCECLEADDPMEVDDEMEARHDKSPNGSPSESRGPRLLGL
jgi:hypothetical protein